MVVRQAPGHLAAVHRAPDRPYRLRLGRRRAGHLLPRPRRVVRLLSTLVTVTSTVTVTVTVAIAVPITVSRAITIRRAVATIVRPCAAVVIVAIARAARGDRRIRRHNILKLRLDLIDRADLRRSQRCKTARHDKRRTDRCKLNRRIPRQVGDNDAAEGTILRRARGGYGEDDSSVVVGAGQDYRASFEARMKRVIEELLEQSVGMGRVRAEVSAEIDLDRLTTSDEIYDPDGQVVRSSQVVEERSDNSESDAAGAVTVGSNLPDGEVSSQAAPSNVNSTERTEETTNYEISKTIRSYVRESGTVKRLSVAVLIDGTYTQDADGEYTYQPRSDDEIEKFTALVRTAVGYDAERGDTLEVVHMQFARIEAIEGEAPPLVDLCKGDYFKIAEIAVMFVVGILVVLLVLRPLASRALGESGHDAGAGGGMAQAALAGPASGAAPQLPASTAADVPPPTTQLDSTIDVANIEGRMKVSPIKRVGEIVDNHPDEALNIIRNWLNQDA